MSKGRSCIRPTRIFKISMTVLSPRRKKVYDRRRGRSYRRKPGRPGADAAVSQAGLVVVVEPRRRCAVDRRPRPPGPSATPSRGRRLDFPTLPSVPRRAPPQERSPCCAGGAASRAGVIFDTCPCVHAATTACTCSQLPSVPSLHPWQVHMCECARHLR